MSRDFIPDERQKRALRGLYTEYTVTALAERFRVTRAKVVAAAAALGVQKQAPCTDDQIVECYLANGSIAVVRQILGPSHARVTQVLAERGIKLNKVKGWGYGAHLLEQKEKAKR